MSISAGVWSQLCDGRSTQVESHCEIHSTHRQEIRSPPFFLGVVFGDLSGGQFEAIAEALQVNQGIREISLNGNFLSAEGREAWVGSKGVGKGDVAAFLLKVLETSKALPTPAFMGNGSVGWTRSQELTILISH